MIPTKVMRKNSLPELSLSLKIVGAYNVYHGCFSGVPADLQLVFHG